MPPSCDHDSCWWLLRVHCQFTRQMAIWKPYCPRNCFPPCRTNYCYVRKEMVPIHCCWNRCYLYDLTCHAMCWSFRSSKLMGLGCSLSSCSSYLWYPLRNVLEKNGLDCSWNYRSNFRFPLRWIRLHSYSSSIQLEIILGILGTRSSILSSLHSPYLHLWTANGYGCNLILRILHFRCRTQLRLWRIRWPSNYDC